MSTYLYVCFAQVRGSVNHLWAVLEVADDIVGLEYSLINDRKYSILFSLPSDALHVCPRTTGDLPVRLLSPR
jgi:hypothetical protein